MRARIGAQLGGRRAAGRAWIGTFHGIAHRLLRLHWRGTQAAGGLPGAGFADDQQRWSNAWRGRWGDEAAPPPDCLVDQCLQKDGPAPAAHPSRIRRMGATSACCLRRLYRARCRRGLVDFRNCCWVAHELLRDTRLLAHYRHRFRADRQWTSSRTPTPSSTVSLACWPSEGQVFVVGDGSGDLAGAAQGRRAMRVSCPATAGAQTIRGFGTNYRSSKNILNAANAVIFPQRGSPRQKRL